VQPLSRSLKNLNTNELDCDRSTWSAPDTLVLPSGRLCTEQAGRNSGYLFDVTLQPGWIMAASFWWLPLLRTGVTNREVWAKLAVKWDFVTLPAPRVLLHDTRPDSATAASASLGDDHLLLSCLVTATTMWHCIVGRGKFYIIPLQFPPYFSNFLQFISSILPYIPFLFY